MSKKRSVVINTGLATNKEEVSIVSPDVTPLDQLNRYLPPHVKYTFDEFVSKFPEKVGRIVAHANLSDDALLGYVKTLVIVPQEQSPVEIIPEQTEEE